jgi:hypothetical protein
MRRGNTIGIRLLPEDEEPLRDVVAEKRSNSSAVIAKIVHDWLHFMKSKQERGDITLAGEIIKNLLNAISKSELVKIAKKNAKYVMAEMRWQDDNLDFTEMSKRIMEWNMENERTLISREKVGVVAFKQRHDLGIGWSTHQCEMYAEMFRLVGETVNPGSIKYGRDSFTFEIIRHENKKY